MNPDTLFDNYCAAARGWRADATLYTGSRRAWRLRKAQRFEIMADAVVESL